MKVTDAVTSLAAGLTPNCYFYFYGSVYGYNPTLWRILHSFAKESVGTLVTSVPTHSFLYYFGKTVQYSRQAGLLPSGLLPSKVTVTHVMLLLIPDP